MSTVTAADVHLTPARVRAALDLLDGTACVWGHDGTIKTAKAINAFGRRAAEALANTDGTDNLLISAHSIHQALSMALEAAAGETRAEMEALLGVTEDTDITALSRALTPRAAESVVMAVANALWASPDVTLDPAFARAIAEAHGAVVDTLDFTAPEAVDTVNAWAAENTRGMIQRVLSELPKETRALLANAVYFKGAWDEPFDKALTEDRPFMLADREAPVPTMLRQDDMAYIETDALQAVALPYGGKDYEAVIILPKADKAKSHAAAGAEAGAGGTGHGDARVWFSDRPGLLSLPRIDITWRENIRDTLAALGMPLACSDAADFSRLAESGGFKIGSVVHSTALKVDEEGSEAAAVTMIAFECAAAMPRPKVPFVMEVNRPFVFAIRHVSTGLVLFLGLVSNPTA